MVTKTVIFRCDDDWQMKSAALLTQKASAFRASIFLGKDERRANAKSLLGVMSLGMIDGDELVVSVDGEDEEAALEAVTNYLEQADKDQ
ncbi:MAG TPA: HPr family phosphocarrier protein [Fastidiosipila sp.]|jgi:phosphotransferase system HPr (HPr) family protein|nr:HPr family phosphocarrier protein [Fastidiosipila sp.]